MSPGPSDALVAQSPAQPTPRWLLREVAPDSWDGLLWGAGGVAVLGIVFSSLVPLVADLAVLFSLTLILNGPYGFLIPAAQEPVLMVFARLHHPAVVAAVATASVTTVEYLNYRLFKAAVDSRHLAEARGSPHMRRVVRWFNWQPFGAIAFSSLTPIPFWAVRIVSVTAAYPVTRHLAANAAGRFFRFWLYAAIGLVLPLTSGQIVLGGAIVTVVLGIAVWHRRRSRGSSAAATGAA